MSLVGDVAVAAASAFAKEGAKKVFSSKPKSPSGSTTSSSFMSPVQAESSDRAFSAGTGGAQTAKAKTSDKVALKFPGDNPILLTEVWNKFFIDQLTEEPERISFRRKKRS